MNTPESPNSQVMNTPGSGPKRLSMLLNIGKWLPSVQNDSPVMNTSGSLNSPVVNTLGSLSSPVVNTLRNLKFPVMNTPVSPFLGVLWTSTEQIYKETLWWQTVQELRLPNVFITGESCLPDVFCPETRFSLFHWIRCSFRVILSILEESIL